MITHAGFRVVVKTKNLGDNIKTNAVPEKAERGIQTTPNGFFTL